MVNPQAKGLYLFLASGPMPCNETYRRAALVQALVFQRRELIDPCNYQNSCPNGPRVILQPHTLFNHRVQGDITQVDYHAESHPDAKVAYDEQCHQQHVVRALTGHDVEHFNEG